MASITRNVWFYVAIIGFILAVIAALLRWVFKNMSTWVWILGGIGLLMLLIGLIATAVTSKGTQTVTVDASKIGLGNVGVGIDNRGAWLGRPETVTTVTRQATVQ
ncbi:hypothetical protein D3C87_879640 [compost metagenome]